MLDDGQHRVRAPASTARPLRELHLLTAKPFLYVFNVDDDELANEAFTDELRALVAPAEAIFLDAKIEAELSSCPTTRRWSCSSRWARRSPGFDQLARVGFATLGLQTYLTAGPEGVPRLDDPGRRHRARRRPA